MQQSDEIGELAAALAKAQGAIKNPKKIRDNPHFKSVYADLAGGIDCIRVALSGTGIAVVQAPEIRGGGGGDILVLHTRLIHSSGQWIGSVYPVAPCGIPHQQLAAAMTYARRQSLFALVEIAGEEDDKDGEDIGDTKGRGNGAVITADQVKELRVLIQSAGADEQRFLKYLGFGSLAVLPVRQFENARAALEGKMAGAPSDPKL